LPSACGKTSPVPPTVGRSQEERRERERKVIKKTIFKRWRRESLLDIYLQDTYFLKIALLPNNITALFIK
jgi:hypothetical protein